MPHRRLPDRLHPARHRGSARECLLLAERFLHFVLAHVAQPARNGLDHRFRSVGLGYRDDPGALTVPTATCSRRDFLADFGNPFGQA